MRRTRQIGKVALEKHCVALCSLMLHYVDIILASLTNVGNA